MANILGVLFFLLLAATKILLAPGIMLAAGYSVVKASIITYFGGLIGAVIFYYFGVAIFNWWDKLVGNKNKDKFIFSSRARAMVKVKIRYGIMGIAFLAPIISVPVSALIVAKFFPGKHKVIGIYALVLIPISIGLTFLSEPVIQPLLTLFKRILDLQ